MILDLPSREREPDYIAIEASQEKRTAVEHARLVARGTGKHSRGAARYWGRAAALQKMRW